MGIGGLFSILFIYSVCFFLGISFLSVGSSNSNLFLASFLNTFVSKTSVLYF